VYNHEQAYLTCLASLKRNNLIFGEKKTDGASTLKGPAIKKISTNCNDLNVHLFID
jgi:hypothetical protein